MRDDITPVMKELKDMGLRVFYSESRHGFPPTYCFFSDGTNVGYVQIDRLIGIKFSTVHVPHRQSGTGFGDLSHDGTLAGGVKASFARAPAWASAKDAACVTKYRDLEHWLTSHNRKPLVYVEYTNAS